MWRILTSSAALVIFATSAAAQIGRTVAVAAGSDQDRALAPIYAAPDNADKIAMIDKFMTTYGKGDYELLGDRLYMQTYLAMKDYPKVFEYGDKALALDPEDLSAAVTMTHAAEDMGDAQRLFTIGEKVSQMVARFRASPAPEGTPADQWKQKQQEAFRRAQDNLNYVEYAMMQAAYKTSDPAVRASLFERYVAAFPDSSYAPSAREQTAFAYQQARDNPKMISSAKAGLVADPHDASLLLLLADYWSESGQHVEEAASNARKALDALRQANKPDNVTDEQWKQETDLEKGLAYSCLGEVDVIGGRNTTAVEAFQQANPLLRSNAFYYGRNLYRLGFTLAKMKRIPEARNVLTEALSVNSPYKSRAQETLDKIGGPASRRRKRS
jgi:tetratricopeptide (TPR) repeat protein